MQYNRVCMRRQLILFALTFHINSVNATREEYVDVHFVYCFSMEILKQRSENIPSSLSQQQSNVSFELFVKIFKLEIVT